MDVSIKDKLVDYVMSLLFFAIAKLISVMDVSIVIFCYNYGCVLHDLMMKFNIMHYDIFCPWMVLQNTVKFACTNSAKCQAYIISNVLHIFWFNFLDIFSQLHDSIQFLQSIKIQWNFKKIMCPIFALHTICPNFKYEFKIHLNDHLSSLQTYM
jgi:hypothetical protein